MLQPRKLDFLVARPREPQHRAMIHKKLLRARRRRNGEK
jgi:hypothetical protein